ncbi:MAG: glycosyltransferase family 4 protein [Cyclobacteriaceae bacterium]|nr:glycosyltransferase family 4 protein [Cyclobacteriaceae bacterium]
MKAVLISSFLPHPTGAGGNIGAFAIASSISASGYNVGICYTGTGKIGNEEKFHYKLANCFASTLEERKILVKRFLDEYQPDVVWIHPIPDWENFGSLSLRYPHVVVAGDPLDLIKKFRFRYDGGAEKGILRRVKYYIENRLEARKIYKLERDFLRACKQRGVVAAYGVGDIKYREKQINTRVELCELSFPNYIEKVSYSGIKNFLVLGNFDTIHTRYGVEFFLKRIWPIWRKSSLLNSATVRLVGGGRYPEKRLGPPPQNQEGLKFIGFADSILEEYRNAIAVLVSVPIKLGFRTRVVEAWAHGVPVIMDASSQIGLPEAIHGKNCLIANNPEQFIEHSLKLINSEELRQTLSDGGRSTFENHYFNSSEIVQRRYDKISRNAISKFNNG